MLLFILQDNSNISDHKKKEVARHYLSEHKIISFTNEENNYQKPLVTNNNFIFLNSNPTAFSWLRNKMAAKKTIWVKTEFFLTVREKIGKMKALF